MSRAAIIQDELIAKAKANGPQDALTIAAELLSGIISWLLFPLVLIIPISTFILGLANMLSFGIVSLVLSIVWWLPLSILMGSSWVWLKLPWTRPLLLIPGAIFAQLSASYAALCPSMGEHESRAMKGAICHGWPLSILILRLAKSDAEDEETL